MASIFERRYIYRTVVVIGVMAFVTLNTLELVAGELIASNPTSKTLTNQHKVLQVTGQQQQYREQRQHLQGEMRRGDQTTQPDDYLLETNRLEQQSTAQHHQHQARKQQQQLQEQKYLTAKFTQVVQVTTPSQVRKTPETSELSERQKESLRQAVGDMLGFKTNARVLPVRSTSRNNSGVSAPVLPLSGRDRDSLGSGAPRYMHRLYERFTENSPDGEGREGEKTGLRPADTIRNINAELALVNGGTLFVFNVTSLDVVVETIVKAELHIYKRRTTSTGKVAQDGHLTRASTTSHAGKDKSTLLSSSSSRSKLRQQQQQQPQFQQQKRQLRTLQQESRLQGSVIIVVYELGPNYLREVSSFRILNSNRPGWQKFDVTDAVNNCTLTAGYPPSGNRAAGLGQPTRSQQPRLLAVSFIDEVLQGSKTSAGRGERHISTSGKQGASRLLLSSFYRRLSRPFLMIFSKERPRNDMLSETEDYADNGEEDNVPEELELRRNNASRRRPVADPRFTENDDWKWDFEDRVANRYHRRPAPDKKVEKSRSNDAKRPTELPVQTIASASIGNVPNRDFVSNTVTTGSGKMKNTTNLTNVPEVTSSTVSTLNVNVVRNRSRRDIIDNEVDDDDDMEYTQADHVLQNEVSLPQSSRQRHRFDNEAMNPPLLFDGLKSNRNHQDIGAYPEISRRRTQQPHAASDLQTTSSTMTSHDTTASKNLTLSHLPSLVTEKANKKSVSISSPRHRHEGNIFGGWRPRSDDNRDVRRNGRHRDSSSGSRGPSIQQLLQPYGQMSERGRAGRRRNRLGSSLTKGETQCNMHRLVIDFVDIGWGDWIISPKSFEANYCDGDCPFPISQRLRPSNHATLQSIVHAVALNHTRAVPSPCCVPASLTSVTLLYFDEKQNVVLKNFPDMSVRTCACR